MKNVLEMGKTETILFHPSSALATTQNICIPERKRGVGENRNGCCKQQHMSSITLPRHQQLPQPLILCSKMTINTTNKRR
mmetsp:Transcript_13633/g.31689  ORF Transcript_13633/g.31689 Transcript_13633/m.31689 type:complete len:80 (-) Transcript_13633:455-694(-)